MPEQIYQAVWCQVFAATCVRLHAEDQNIAIDTATVEAEWAASNAVEHWSDMKQTAAIVKANKSSDA